MLIIVNYDQAVDSLPTGFVDAVNYVVTYFDNLFTNSVTVTVNVGYGEIAGTPVGGALASSSIDHLRCANLRKRR